MNALTAARAQMEVSLAFHMVFAALGIGMPLLMVLAEAIALRTGSAEHKRLARTWGKATALLFAVGAVSGTALSFELGLLWPRFMDYAGAVLGPAFALEGYAFFLEAIFVGLYLYGWEKLSPRAHLLTGIPVAITGAVSGVLVVAANAWMQNPVHYAVHNGRAVPDGAFSVFLNPVWAPMALHSTLSCYVSVGFAVAGVYAFGMLRGKRDAYHRAGLGLALAMAGVAAVLQLTSGHQTAATVARYQPTKLAAMEALFHTQRGAPSLLGGVPDEATQTVRYGVEVPYGLSVLAFEDPHAEVRGLDAFPRETRPPVLVTHFAFQLMVGSGTALAAAGVLYAILAWRDRRKGTSLREHPWVLRALVACSPLGFVALEAGWFVTEVGRQPWVIQGVLRTRDAVTNAGGVLWSFYGFTLLYLALAGTVIYLLNALAKSAAGARAGGDDGGPDAH